MRDGHISISKVITLALWTWMVVLIVLAWVAFADGLGRVPFLLGLTGCASSAVAATAQIRCYTLEVCRIMRSIEWPADPDGGLRSL